MSRRVFELGSYFWMLPAEAMYRDALSGDHELAVGVSSNVKQDGRDEGARLRAAGSAVVSASLDASANMVVVENERNTVTVTNAYGASGSPDRDRTFSESIRLRISPFQVLLQLQWVLFEPPSSYQAL